MKHILFLLLFLSSSIEIFSQCEGTAGQVTWSYWQNLPITYNFQELYSTDRFPNGPDGVRAINSLRTPSNFTEYFGGQIKGYLQVPQTANVIFNITGDDQVQFFLSLDDTPENLSLIATIEDATEEEAHEETASQTSTTLTLVAGRKYYFELNYLEFGWADFAMVYWKTTFLEGVDATANWSLITSEYLSDSCDTPCTDRGTPCDDGDATTSNDQADGNCNCIGTPTTSNSCIGERGILQPYIYENLPTNNLEDMYSAAHYPDAPDRMQPLKDIWFERTLSDQGEANNYGTRIQAFISVPVTGNYDFNITGSVENIFYLSSDETVANKTDNSILTYWWTGIFGHVTETSWTEQQTMTDVYLEAGKYYYVELVHKGVEDYSFFGLFWNGPQHTDDTWRRVPTFYFFDYTCETACLKAGVACNDNNAYTANDIWDGNCNCAGTPCSGPGDCDDPAAIYPRFEACEITDNLDNRAADAWLSCAPLSTNPNASRGANHWIQYDFESPFNLSNIHVWNYNVANATNLGFQEVVIDYSMDGVNWQELGTYTWAQATGASAYKGFDVPNMETISAQYILITSLDPTTTCRGLSKVTFTAFNCPTITFSNPTDGQSFASPANPTVSVSIDNGLVDVQEVALYIGDNLVSRDASAPYIWTGGALANLPAGNYTLQAVSTDAEGVKCSNSIQLSVTGSDEECQTIPLTISTITQAVYRTSQTISSTATVSTKTDFFAEQSITLEPGFDAVAGSDFTAQIEACNIETLAEVATKRTSPPTDNLSETTTNLSSSIQLYPNPVESNFSIAVNVPTDAIVQVRIYNVAGQLMRNLSYQKAVGAGNYTIQLSADQLASGIYYCRVRVGEEEHVTSFVKGGL